MIEYTRHFLVALLLNILVETSVIILLVRRIFKVKQEEIATVRLVLASVFANSLTLPYVWYIFPILIYRSYTGAIGVGEFFAFIAEALFYFVFLKLNLKRSIIVSFLANAASFLLVSFLIQIIFRV